MKALFWEKKKGKKVQCHLCPRNCVISEGDVGDCGVRKNVKGKLESLVYGRVAALNIDPIEKKPLYHFAPGTRCVSFSTVGCNLHCKFCQNWELSQTKEISGREMSPKELVEHALENNQPGIAATYIEPTVFYEYMLDVFKLAKKKDLYTVMVSNGYIQREPLKKLIPHLDAANIDLKGDKHFYRKLCKVPDSKPVFETVKTLTDKGVHVETTCLVIPGWNDKPSQVEELVKRITDIDKTIPFHFSRYHPCHKMEAPPTPVATLERAAKIADKSLDYVYLGNVSSGWESTRCPRCGEIVIKRSGYNIEARKHQHKFKLAGKRWIS